MSSRDSADVISAEAAVPSAPAGLRLVQGEGGRELPSAIPAGVRVSLVVPAMNEAENLPHVFARLPEGLHEVILVDGRSTDETVEVARRLHPDVRIVHQTKKGKGDALAVGFAACTGDVVVMIDADRSTDPAEIPLFIQALVDGADFAKGSRFLAGGGSADITPLRRVGNKALNAVVNLLYGTRYSDLCYGYNAFRRTVLDSLVVDCAGFEVETLMNIRVAKLGLKVAEVPSFESPRLHGESNLRPFRDGLRVLRVVIRERFSPAPTLASERAGEIVETRLAVEPEEACAPCVKVV
ncbi:MAG: putative glycosyltransferase [Acidimicrobiaceae bacterium]|nr:putative glycosyltransferase [Acidimicrobiaceae bacterium]